MYPSALPPTFHVLMNKVFILLYHHVSNEKWSKSPEVNSLNAQFSPLTVAVISCTAYSSLLYAV